METAQRSSNCSGEESFGDASSVILKGDALKIVEGIREAAHGSLASNDVGGLRGCEYRLGEYCAFSLGAMMTGGALSRVG